MIEKRVIFVLGHRLDAQDQPPCFMRERVRRAFDLIEEREEAPFYHNQEAYVPFDAVVLCGGITRPGQVLSEASLMEKLLAGNAVGTHFLPPLFLEEASQDTLENLINGTGILLEEYPGSRFTITAVTHRWHAGRVWHYWQHSRHLRHARQYCQLDLTSALISSRSMNAARRFLQQLANLESFWDPNRTLLNWVRPHAV